ncbi:hypothetical protein RB10135 [Rhodopirellula baltica SH 1]|uniref:Uncharacterized protein n=1 Tax=Rhodopirellula baltica (strain DSM 10527 / NCIMB 13988 / SH1) TaxID=243090 RepID=Q7UFG1_RHOBA|nr:hypothetical protein RB10135 [Rhodopirellula baltica SH 1]
MLDRPIFGSTDLFTSDDLLDSLALKNQPWSKRRSVVILRDSKIRPSGQFPLHPEPFSRHVCHLCRRWTPIPSRARNGTRRRLP